MEGESIMMPAGVITCFNCKGEKKNLNGKTYPIKKLEVWRKSNNPKSKSKGKLIAWAWVCSLCESEGHNKVPVDPGAFRGEARYAPVPPEMMNFLKKQKEAAEQKKAEFEKIEPKYPTKE